MLGEIIAILWGICYHLKRTGALTVTEKKGGLKYDRNDD